MAKNHFARNVLHPTFKKDFYNKNLTTKSVMQDQLHNLQFFNF